MDFFYVEANEKVGSPPGIVIKMGEISGEPYGQVFPLEMVASWSELLGYSDVVDTLSAICQVLFTGSPPADSRTGENAWTEVYSMLSLREELREEAVVAEIQADAHHPRSRELVGALAVHQGLPRDGDGECVLDKCRRTARQRLAVPNPERNPSMLRSRSLSCDIEPHSDSSGVFTPEDRSKASMALSRVTEEISEKRKPFLHSLSSFEDDPLAESVPEEDEERPPPTTGEILSRYLTVNDNEEEKINV